MTSSTPVYASEWATVYHADARDVLGAMPNEAVDLVVVDPPYGVEWQSNRRAESFGQLDGDGAHDDDRAGIMAVLAESVRVVGQNRHLYVFGPARLVAGLKVTAPVELVWHKGTMNGGDLTAPWGPIHEPISFVVSKQRHAGEAGSSSVAARLRKGTIITATRPTGRKVRHPSEKPVKLLRELIESSSRAGELVLDPCAGIGSTAVAAILAGRRAIIVDTDRRYVDIAIERIRKAEAIAAQAATV